MTRIVRFADRVHVAEPGITGFLMAPVLERGPITAKFWRVPAGWNIGCVGVERNLHVHERVWEYAAILAGDFPHVEYDDERAACFDFRFHAGDLMIRPPGSLHGLRAELAVHERCDILYWNTGSGTSLLDADYHAQTTDLGEDADLRAHARGRCRIVNVETAAGSGWTELSRPGEPQRVRLRRTQAGTRLPLAELCESGTTFALLWSGSARVVRRGASTFEVPRWTTIVHSAVDATADAAADDGSVVDAVEDCLWLRVDAPAPGSSVS